MPKPKKKKPVVKVNMNVQNIDYHTLAHDPAMMKEMQERIVKKMAADAGVDPSSIKLKFGAGSLSIQASITPPHGVDVKDLNKKLPSAEHMGGNIGAAVASTPGVDKVAAGPVTVSGVASEESEDDDEEEPEVQLAGAAGISVASEKKKHIPTVLEATKTAGYISEDPTEQTLLAAILPGYGTGKAETSVQLNRCGDDLDFARPRVFQRYFSMITFSNLFFEGDPQLSELREQRVRARNGLVVSFFIGMIVKYSNKIIELVGSTTGSHYMQLWGRSRTSFDRCLESAVFQSLAIIYTLTVQITLCTLYLTFWKQDNFFVMSYIPSCGLCIFLGSCTMIGVGNILDRCYGVMLRCTNRGIICFWILYILWMIMVTMPMVGYFLFSLQYVGEVVNGGWIRNSTVFSEAYILAAHKAMGAMMMFLMLAVVDVFVLVASEMKKFH